jgi:polygalacturonase
MATRRGAALAVAVAALSLALCAAAIGASASPAGAGCRKHVKSIADYGAVGDGKTLNTAAFAKAVADLSACAGDGGAALVVPEGRWLTGPFNLTSHFTLFLRRGAEILASQVLPLSSTVELMALKDRLR